MSKVYLVYYPPGEPCADYGRDWMIEDFAASGIETQRLPYWGGHETDFVIVAGLHSYSFISKLLREEGIQPQGRAEGVILRWARFGEQRLLVAAGTDARGLMYALSELGDVARCGGLEALRQVENTEEYPDLNIRGSDRFVLGPRDDDWYYSEDFWHEHMKKLARYRFNRFTFIVGNDTWYMTPPYPFFIQTPGYETVTIEGQDDARREKTLHILQLMSRLCHDYGMEFTLSSWQQLPWTDNQSLRVHNIPTDDKGFTEYAAKSVQVLLQACPYITGMQFRFNMEAGVSADMPEDIRKGAKESDGINGAKSFIDGHTEERSGHETHNSFWYRMIDALASVGRPLKVDLRMKGLTDELIEYTMQKETLEPVLATKYWCEHMGSAYPYTKRRAEESASIARYGNEDYNALRRYSFDNVLGKPHAYDMLYRLWNYGSAILFLWGDPEYVRRFSSSCAAAHGTGFTFCEPLSLKGGQAILPGEAWPVHTNDKMRTYAWEDDRYWMFYLCFGRVGYSRSTKPEVWQRELRQRFGAAAPAVERMYRFGSRIIPLITTAHFPRHPSQHYWPELFAGNSIYKENNYVEYNNMFSYATSNPSDEQLFASIDKAVQAHIEGKPIDVFHPLIIRDWYHTLSQQVLAAGQEAEAAGAKSIGEWYPTQVDFNMLAGIARYHSQIVLCAWSHSLFEKTGDKAAGARAYEALLKARAEWEQVSVLGDENYARNLLFDIGTGMRRNGNWRDRLPGQIDKDIETMAAQLREQGIEPPAVPLPSPYHSVAQAALGVDDVAFDVPESAPSGQALRVAVHTSDLTPFTGMRLYYRHMNHREEYVSTPMRRDGDRWVAEIPADYVQYQWDMVVYFVGHSYENSAVMLPGMYSRHSDFPFFVVRTER